MSRQCEGCLRLLRRMREQEERHTRERNDSERQLSAERMYIHLMQREINRLNDDLRAATDATLLDGAHDA